LPVQNERANEKVPFTEVKATTSSLFVDLTKASKYTFPPGLRATAYEISD
jgi:hypothetical protein